MNLNIIHEKENHLFSRKEVVAEVKKESSPKRDEIENLLAEKFSTAKEAVKIEKIMPKFSSDVFTIYARIYKSKEEKESIEPRIKVKAAKQA
jgi:ribosomal protein S24E